MNKKTRLLLVFITLFCISLQNDYKSFIADLGLDFEEAQVTTEDRYINTIWMIRSKNKNNRNGKAIILQHGLLDGGWTYLILGKKSLAYKLAEEYGYTVYLPYVRGTQFSLSHSHYRTGCFSDYWNFSFDEIAKYDLPAFVNYVKQKEGVSKVDYIGHSQGTLIFFLNYMNDPEFMEKNINKFVAVGTVPNVNNAPHPLLQFIQKSKILDFIPFKNMLAFSPELNKITVPICTSKLMRPVCEFALKFCFSGLKDTGKIDYERLDSTIFMYEPGGTSLQNIKHWMQIHSAKRVQKYDYGSFLANLKRYGTLRPPAYDLKKMNGYSIPSLMTTSDSDPFALPKDTEDFIDNIKNKSVVELLRLKNYNHIDYIWADSAVDDVFPKIFDFLKK